MMERAVHVKCMGGLGNQLFQYWTAYSLARKNNCPVFCDPRKGFREWARTNILRKCTNRPFVLNKFSKMNVCARNAIRIKSFAFAACSAPMRIYKERDYSYDENVLALKPPIYLLGYWQNHRYFQNFRETIISSMIPTAIPHRMNQYMKTTQRCPVTSIHVRRADYERNPRANKFHGLCSMEYYNEAISLLKDKTERFFLFTDDPEWCQRNFRHIKNLDIVSQESFNEICEMHLMSQCRNNIMANSSFGWWGAWLNQNKEQAVVAPKRWFKEESHQEYSPCLDNWIRL